MKNFTYLVVSTMVLAVLLQGCGDSASASTPSDTIASNTFHSNAIHAPSLPNGVVVPTSEIENSVN